MRARARVPMCLCIHAQAAQNDMSSEGMCTLIHAESTSDSLCSNDTHVKDTLAPADTRFKTSVSAPVHIADF